jgi:predicted unusual protein kinase regulating ubiquinone biosynthesis (AarF/ABC1/UbiB family)
MILFVYDLSIDRIGLLDWGQVKRLPPKILYKFSQMVIALHHQDFDKIVSAFFDLGLYRFL